MLFMERTLCYRAAIPPYLRNPVLQTVLSSMRLRNRGITDFERFSREVIVLAGGGVRLSGFYTPAVVPAPGTFTGASAQNYPGIPAGASAETIPEISSKPSGGKGLVILLHGWEGSESSAYMVSAGRYFYNIGYDIFRLNMRDHGSSHHLNRGLFLGTLIDEAYGAVKRIVADCFRGGKLFLVGFSMGASFALRIARISGLEKHENGNAPAFDRVFAVNPPLDPLSATSNIDKHSIIKKYFLKKWKRSLLRKQSAFPELYDFDRFLKTDNCIDLTRLLIEEYSEYKSMEDYFSRYTLDKKFFAEIETPVTLITAADDPVIDISRFDAVKSAANPYIDLVIEPYGGHCAYIRNIKLETYLFDIIAEKTG